MIIKLKNGMVIDCILNGNNYITQQNVSLKDLFEDYYILCEGI